MSETSNSAPRPLPTVTVPIETLRAHPALKLLPTQAKDSDALIPLADHIQEHGFPDSIKITADHQIVDLDSHDRWLAARRYAIANVPCQIVPDDAVYATLIGNLVLRRHYTKGALAYLIFPLLNYCKEENQARSLANLKNRRNPLVQSSASQRHSTESLPKIAERYGIARNVFQFAEELHRIFNKAAADRSLWLASNPSFDDNHPDCPADLRAEWEPRILDPVHPIGLGAVFAGMEGIKTRGLGRAECKHLKLFLKGWKTLGLRAGWWKELSRREKEQLIEQIQPDIEAIPDDLWEALSDLREGKEI